MSKYLVIGLLAGGLFAIGKRIYGIYDKEKKHQENIEKLFARYFIEERGFEPPQKVFKLDKTREQEFKRELDAIMKEKGT